MTAEIVKAAGNDVTSAANCACRIAGGSRQHISAHQRIRNVLANLHMLKRRIKETV